MHGSATQGYLLIGDAGFDFPMPANLLAQGLLSPRNYCDQNDIAFLVPFNRRSNMGLVYNAALHLLTEVPAQNAPVSQH